MKKNLLRLIVILAATLAHPGAWALPYSNLYILGDSLSDQGNLYAATQDLFPPGIAPIPADDHYFQGRFSNGEIYAGLLANKLGLSSTRSSAGGNNFAYGGARTDYNRVEASAPVNLGGILPTGARPWSLNLERDAFAARGINDPNALYVVWSGANDLGDIIPLALTGQTALAAQFLNAAVIGVKDVIDAYLAAGAQTILVPNIPDLGLVPDVFGLDPLFPGAPPLVAQTATALTQQFNTAVDLMLSGYGGVNIIRYDSFNFLRNVVANPGAYGLTNASAACYTGFVAPAGPNDTVCANPDSYLFWDGEHPSAAFHQLIADQFFAAVPEPGTVLLLLVGLAALWGAQRRQVSSGLLRGAQ